MCILYRGAGSLPRDRAGIYGRCAELLLGKWDESRRIHHELQAGHLVEPAIRHLAWWLFNSQDSRGAVTERALIDEATEFLHGRGFESVEEARAAAREFVEFCGGRMWVLSDAGTTADGEKLYSFTHRTFLEYFAAAHLATMSDTPEDLARVLAPHIRSVKGWNLVGELAIQVKDRSSYCGADRIYAALLDAASAPGDRGPLLVFLAECLESARLSPATLRSFTRVMLGYRFEKNTPLLGSHPLRLLLRRSSNYEQHIIADEMSSRIAAMVTSDDKVTHDEGLLLVLEVGQGDASAFWSQWSAEQANRYAAEIIAEAARFSRFRTQAVDARVISLEQALGMPGGLSALMETYPRLLTMYSPNPYPISLYYSLMDQIPSSLFYSSAQLMYRPRSSEDAIRELALVGRHLADNPDLPWVRTAAFPRRESIFFPNPNKISDRLDNFSGLGIAALHAMYKEITYTEISSRDVLAGLPGGILVPPGSRRNRPPRHAPPPFGRMTLI